MPGIQTRKAGDNLADAPGPFLAYRPQKLRSRGPRRLTEVGDAAPCSSQPSITTWPVWASVTLTSTVTVFGLS